MSRPRAATSLHTSSRSSPALNFSSVAKRTVCAMSPCSAPTSNLCRGQRLVAGCPRRSCGCRRSARSARSRVRISRRSASRLSCSATSARPSVIVVATEAGARDRDLLRVAAGRRRPAGGSPAPWWRRRTASAGVVGSSATMRSTSGMNPMSSMRSASSITRMLGVGQQDARRARTCRSAGRAWRSARRRRASARPSGRTCSRRR